MSQRCPDHARYLSDCLSCNPHRDTPGCPDCGADLPNLTAAIERAEKAEAHLRAIVAAWDASSEGTPETDDAIAEAIDAARGAS